MSFFYLATIATEKGAYQDALELCEKALCKNIHNIKARALKLYLLRKLNRPDESIEWYEDNLSVDTFDYVPRMERMYLQSEQADVVKKEVNTLCRGYYETYLNIARDYAEFWAYKEAIKALKSCHSGHPMITYYMAYYESIIGKENLQLLENAEKLSSVYIFSTNWNTQENAFRYLNMIVIKNVKYTLQNENIGI